MVRVNARSTERRGPATRTSPKASVIAVVVLCVGALVAVGVWSGSMGAGSVPHSRRIEIFTIVRTGIVYVEPETSEIVWQNLQRDRKSIGESAWTNPGPKALNRVSGLLPWREGRDIVGHPDHDLVAWVETVAGERGDIVVVEASSGDELARAAIRAPSDHPVVIASVDEEAVYFATPDPTTGWPDVPRADVWVWPWAAGDEPFSRRSGRYLNDVSAGIWAVYGDGLEFEDSTGRTLSSVEFTAEKPTDFGSSLSPDGRFWYGARTSQIIETATGRVIAIPGARERNYGWTSTSELTLTRPPTLCSALTGRCHGPGFLLQGQCAPYGIVCGDRLPVN